MTKVTAWGEKSDRNWIFGKQWKEAGPKEGH